MGIFSWLFGRKRKLQMQSPGGVCSNCWGKQEWDKRFMDIVKDKQIDMNNHEVKLNFIQDFVENHLDGIQLKRREKCNECPSCKAKYHLK